MGYAKEDAEHFNMWQSTTRDVIASLRTLINKVLIVFSIVPRDIYTYLNI